MLFFMAKLINYIALIMNDRVMMKIIFHHEFIDHKKNVLLKQLTGKHFSSIKNFKNRKKLLRLAS